MTKFFNQHYYILCFVRSILFMLKINAKIYRKFTVVSSPLRVKIFSWGEDTPRNLCPQWGMGLWGRYKLPVVIFTSRGQAAQEARRQDKLICPGVMIHWYICTTKTQVTFPAGGSYSSLSDDDLV